MQYDYGFRFYNPQLGRWHVPDPLAEMYISLSPFNYVLNNPVNHTDPNGLLPAPNIHGGIGLSTGNSENYDFTENYDPMYDKIMSELNKPKPRKTTQQLIDEAWYATPANGASTSYYQNGVLVGRTTWSYGQIAATLGINTSKSSSDVNTSHNNELGDESKGDCCNFQNPDGNEIKKESEGFTSLSDAEVALDVEIDYKDPITGTTSTTPLSNTYYGIYLESKIEAIKAGTSVDLNEVPRAQYATKFGFQVLNNYNWKGMGLEARATFFDRHMLYDAIRNPAVCQAFLVNYKNAIKMGITPLININYYYPKSSFHESMR